MRANRARPVAAWLTLYQARASAGRPPTTGSLGTFETWSQTLGGILHVAGVPGLLGKQDEVMEASDRRGEMDEMSSTCRQTKEALKWAMFRHKQRQ